MSIEQQDIYYAYTGNGVTTDFSFGCRIFNSSDLRVTVAGGVKTQGTHYDVSGINAAAGGRVTFRAGYIPASGELVELERVLVCRRGADYVQDAKFLSATFDQEQDYQTALIQQALYSIGINENDINDLREKLYLFALNIAGQYIKTSVSCSSFGTDISEAITAIGDANVTLIIDSAITCNNDAQTHENTLVIAQRPGTVNVADGKTLHFARFSAGRYPVFIGSGSVVFECEAFPDWFGSSVALETLRLSLLGSPAVPSQKCYGGMARINNPQDSSSCMDIAHFAGQGTGATLPSALVVHNYTDAPGAQIDNVGAEPALRLVNATNPGRRVDKPSDYVGQGEFLDLQTAGVGRMFFISKSTEFIWNGRGGSFVTDLTPGAGYPYSFEAYGNHTLLMQIRNNGSRLLVIQDTGGRTEILSERAAGLQLIASQGLVRLKTMAGGSVVVDCGSSNDAYLQAAYGNLKLEAVAGKSVAVNSPLILRSYANIAAAPNLGGGEHAIAWANDINKMIKWDGTSWTAAY